MKTIQLEKAHEATDFEMDLLEAMEFYTSYYARTIALYNLVLGWAEDQPNRVKFNALKVEAERLLAQEIV